MNKTLSILKVYCEFRKKFPYKGMATREDMNRIDLQTM